MTARREILIAGHLGLGDGLLTNAIVRHYAQIHDVAVVCKPENSTTLAFQYRDAADRITLVEADDDAQAKAGIAEIRRHGKQVLGLGFFGGPGFTPQAGFDQVFFEQAGVPHKERWNLFKCARQESRELQVPKGKYCFVHDDPEREFVIPPEALPTARMNIVRPSKDLLNPNGEKCILYDYWGWLDGAEEIHAIDSSFAILVDHLHLSKFGKKRLVLHLGLRGPNEYPPSRNKEWEIVKHNRL